MAGIYFHIPFCKQACHYCDFHFVTSLKYKSEMLQAMQQELRTQAAADFFKGENRLQSIYFGGGTPSILEPEEIAGLLQLCAELFDTKALQEVTLEANPDDLSRDKIQGFRQAGINRLSIGVQSFFEDDLRWMNRAHGAGEAESAIQNAQEAGITNITADLIYGYPLLSDEKWDQNISILTRLGVPHISAYSMTVEPRTALGTLVRRGQEPPMDEDQSAKQFEYLMDRLAELGYAHYEISNWALPGNRAIHNANYWRGLPYLGIGPSAHSYDGNRRYWNASNNPKYIKSIQIGGVPAAEEEWLSTEDRLNEYIMTSLRTSWGLDLKWVKGRFERKFWGPLEEGLEAFEKQGLVQRKTQTTEAESGENQAEKFTLTRSGKLLADRIASDLFYT